MDCTQCREVTAANNCECCNVRLCERCTRRDADKVPFCKECAEALLESEGA